MIANPFSDLIKIAIAYSSYTCVDVLFNGTSDFPRTLKYGLALRFKIILVFQYFNLIAIKDSESR